MIRIAVMQKAHRYIQKRCIETRQISGKAPIFIYVTYTFRGCSTSTHYYESNQKPLGQSHKKMLAGYFLFCKPFPETGCKVTNMKL